MIRPPTGPGYENPFGLTVEQIGTPMGAGEPGTFQRVWRGQVFLGRVINRTVYPPQEQVIGPTAYEPQQWSGSEYEDGPVFSSLIDALEFLT